MSKIIDFMKESGPFFVLTLNDNAPAGRPFGAIMEVEDKLYISTADEKAVYHQIKENGNIQIVALKPGTRDWIRVTGVAVECTSIDIKERMLEECPVLKNHFPSASEPHFCIFEITVVQSEFY